MGDSTSSSISSEAEILARINEVAWIWREYRHTHCWPKGDRQGNEDDLLEQDCKEIDGYMRKNKDNKTIVVEGLQCFGEMSSKKITASNYRFDAAKDLLPPLIPDNPDLIYDTYCEYIMEERHRGTFEQEILNSGFLQMLQRLKEKNPDTKCGDEEDCFGDLLLRVAGFLEKHPDNPHHSSLSLLKSMMVDVPSVDHPTWISTSRHSHDGPHHKDCRSPWNDDLWTA